MSVTGFSFSRVPPYLKLISQPTLAAYLALVAFAVPTLGGEAGQAADEAQSPAITESSEQPESVTLRRASTPVTPSSIDATAVPATVREITPKVKKAARVPAGLVLTDPPTPARPGPRPSAATPLRDWTRELVWEGFSPDEARRLSPLLPAKTLAVTFDSIDFDTNDTNAGSVFIPPDPHGAAGPDHVVAVANVSLRFHQKDGTVDFDDSLANFFAALSPANATFDPKVIYDQFTDRWLILTLERTDVPQGSRILLAVSDDEDPNGSWTMAAINSLFSISSLNYWSDYPGFAVDEEAIYIAVNLFTFPGAFGGNRLFLIDKGEGTGGFYDRGPLTSSVIDPVPAGFFAATQQPGHIFGTAPAGVGTWLTVYSGLSNSVNEFIQVTRVDDPLGTPSLTAEFVSLGNVDNTSAALPDAPQSGSATNIETNDRRTLDAVWRDNSLWTVATLNPPSGVDSGQATAYWAELDTSTLGITAVADSGTIGGEDIATGAHTFFPSIAVNEDGHVGIGFSAGDGSIFAGSYYTSRRASDAAGTTRASQTLRAGLDSYVRTFGTPRNRWGDYTGAAVDPETGCFWFYNEHAIAQGTPTNPGPEQGRWGTAFGLFCSCAGDESTGDTDFDDVCNDADICQGFDDSLDGDADSVPDGCDVCQGFDDSIDADADTVPDGCDVCSGFDDAQDADVDSVPDGCDVCAGFDDTQDADADSVPDGCDICAGSDDAVDTDFDTIPDGCDFCSGDNSSGDTDRDGVCDDNDLCFGDDTSGDADTDGICANYDCDDGDAGVGACPVFEDSFESGDTLRWSSTSR